jgi:hypothetical protein
MPTGPLQLRRSLGFLPAVDIVTWSGFVLVIT